jgi:hypothetical protein
MSHQEEAAPISGLLWRPISIGGSLELILSGAAMRASVYAKTSITNDDTPRR